MVSKRSTLGSGIRFIVPKGLSWLAAVSLLPGLWVGIAMHNANPYLPYFLIVVLIALILVPVFRKDFDVFAPITLYAAMNLGFVLGALNSIIKNMSFLGLTIAGWEGMLALNQALMYIILGLTGYYIGYFFIVRRANIGALKKRLALNGGLVWGKYELRPTMYIVIALLALSGTMAYFWFYVRPMGGVTVLLQNYGRNGYIRLLIETTGASSLGARAMVIAHLIWSVYYLERRVGGILFWFYFAIVAFVMLLSGRIANNFITLLLSFIILYRYMPVGLRKSNRTYMFFSVALVALVLGLYGVRTASSMARVENSSQIIADVFSVDGFVEKIVEGRNIPDINMFAEILHRVPSEIPFQYGQTLLYVPRSIIDRLTTVETYEFTGLSAMLTYHWHPEKISGGLPPTFLGELYVNFGIAGIVLGNVVLGAIAGCVYRWLLYSNNPWTRLIYSILVFQLALLVKIETKVSINMMVDWLFPLVLTLVAVRWFRIVNYNFVNHLRRPYSYD